MSLFRKGLLASCTLILLLGWAGICLANENSVKTITVNNQSFYYDYNENNAGQWLDSEKGWLPGTVFCFKNQDQDTGRYWQVIFGQTSHDTHYNGFYLDSGEPCQSNTATQLTDAEFNYGIPFLGSERALLFFWSGLGYHGWNRALSVAQQEYYSWFYIPVGLQWEWAISERFESALNLTANFMFAGQMKGTTAGYQDFTVNLGNKPGYRIEIPLTYHLTSLWAMKITPWYAYSAIGKSNSVSWVKADGTDSGYSVWEPNSTTKQKGINIGIQCIF